VLTATFNSYENRQISTPHKINTHEPIDKKIGTIDHIRKGTSCTKFGRNPFTGGFWANGRLTHSLTAAFDQLRVVASSTSNDPGPRSRQHQQIGQCLLPLVAANFSVDDPAGASSEQREEWWCGRLLTVAVPAKQVCSPVGNRCDQIMNEVCEQ